MCCTNNLEDLKQIRTALEKREGKKAVVESIILDAAQIADISDANKIPNRYFYGVLTTGNATSVDVQLYGAGVFSLAAQSQYLEVFEDLDNLAGANVFFRGYEVRLKHQ